MTTGIAKIKAASTAAEAIIAAFAGNVPTDALEARKTALLEEVSSLKTTEKVDLLIAKILELEKPKTTGGLTVETVARKFMEEPALAMFTWPQIALLVQRVLPEAKTSSKSIASYASKRKADWNIVQREKFSLGPDELLALANA